MFKIILLLALLINNVSARSPHHGGLIDIRVGAKKPAKAKKVDDGFVISRLEELLAAAEKCSLVMKSDEEILKKYPDAIIHETKKTKVKFFIVKNHEAKTQTIVIRGSANLTNWIIDFKFWKVKDLWLDIKLHKGFYEASREVFWKGIFDCHPEYKTLVTGHSLGGAVAIILGMYMDNYGHPSTRVMAFGQPRVTNSSGTKKFKNFPYERVVVNRDIVPHLPPWIFGFRHWGRKLLLEASKINDALKGDAPRVFSKDSDKPGDDQGQVGEPPSDGENPPEEEDDFEKDPQEALDYWEKITKNHDPESTPVLVPPALSVVWQNIREEDAPNSMKDLFVSAPWKKLLTLESKAEEADKPVIPFYSPDRKSNTVSNERGDFFKWHNLDRYIAKLKELISHEQEGHKPKQDSEVAEDGQDDNSNLKGSNLSDAVQAN